MCLNPYLTHTFVHRPGHHGSEPVWIAAENGTTTTRCGCCMCKYSGELDQAQIQEVEFQNGIMASQKHWPATVRSTDFHQLQGLSQLATRDSHRQQDVLHATSLLKQPWYCSCPRYLLSSLGKRKGRDLLELFLVGSSPYPIKGLV